MPPTILENPPAPADSFIPATAPRIVLLNSERQACEIWTRVMGYHRPVSSFNIGKKGEHKERRFFREAHCAHA
jgi:hypothetical protein